MAALCNPLLSLQGDGLATSPEEVPGLHNLQEALSELEKVVAKQHGKVVMAKADIDDHTDLAIEYEVSAVPTVLAIKNGDVVDKFVGIKDEDQLEAFLKKLIV
eukprot:bmy_01663T0